MSRGESRRPLGGVDDLAAGLPGVAAALGDHVDHAAGGATVLCAIAAGVDLLLVDGVVGQAGEAQARERVRHGVAVDVVLVFRCRRTAERGDVAVTAVTTHGTRGEQGGRGDVTGDGQLLQLLGGEHGARIDRRNVDGRQHVAGDLHAFEVVGGRRGSGFSGERYVDAGADLHGDVVTAADGGAVAQDRDLVAADRQQRGAVAAFAIDVDVAGQARVEIFQVYDVALASRNATERDRRRRPKHSTARERYRPPPARGRARERWDAGCCGRERNKTCKKPLPDPAAQGPDSMNR